jgi:hypothetical protein
MFIIDDSKVIIHVCGNFELLINALKVLCEKRIFYVKATTLVYKQHLQ